MRERVAALLAETSALPAHWAADLMEQALAKQVRRSGAPENAVKKTFITEKVCNYCTTLDNKPLPAHASTGGLVAPDDMKSLPNTGNLTTHAADVPNNEGRAVKGFCMADLASSAMRAGQLARDCACQPPQRWVGTCCKSCAPHGLHWANHTHTLPKVTKSGPHRR